MYYFLMFLPIVFVTEVPTFEPKIIGIVFLTGAPADTKATIIDVEVAEDCTATVTRIPIIIPTIGFERISEFWNRLDKFRPPKIRKAVLRNVREHTNRYRAAIIPKVLRIGEATRCNRPRWWIFIFNLQKKKIR